MTETRWTVKQAAQRDWQLRCLEAVYDITNDLRHKPTCTAAEVARVLGVERAARAGQVLSDLARDGLLHKTFERYDYATYHLTPEGRSVAQARKSIIRFPSPTTG